VYSWLGGGICFNWWSLKLGKRLQNSEPPRSISSPACLSWRKKLTLGSVSSLEITTQPGKLRVNPGVADCAMSAIIQHDRNSLPGRRVISDKCCATRPWRNSVFWTVKRTKKKTRNAILKPTRPSQSTGSGGDRPETISLITATYRASGRGEPLQRNPLAAELALSRKSWSFLIDLPFLGAMKRVSVRLSVGSGPRKGPSAAASTPNPDRKCSRFRWKRTSTFRRAEKAIPGRGINRRMMTGPGAGRKNYPRNLSQGDIAWRRLIGVGWMKKWCTKERRLITALIRVNPCRVGRRRRRKINC
jgi:hypothetical protein